MWQISRTKRDVASIRAKLLAISLFVSFFGFSQSKINTFLTPSDSLHPVRKKTVYIAEASVIGVGLIGLNQLWYADYPQSKFHFYNDNSEWMQMDKVGHFYSTYHVGRFGAELLAWSGASKKEQLCYGATLGLGFLTVVEVFDGFSQEWGFSWGDMTANILGPSLYVGQQYLWGETRIQPKWSFHNTSLAAQNPKLLGKSVSEQWLKDYNGQTYWFSGNISSFLPKQNKFPKWLNLAVGYGIQDMVNAEVAKSQQNGFFPYRQYYLAVDFDLSHIRTKSKFLKGLLFLVDQIKIPAPTLEFSAKKGIIFHPIYF